MANPVEEYLQEKEAAASQRKQKDMELYHAWKADPNPYTLAPLVKAYTPLVVQKSRQWKAPAVEEAGFKAELVKHMINAFETYDPAKAQLNTHVENHMRKALRYNSKYQNVGHISETNSGLIGKIRMAHTQLQEELERDPTHQELAHHIGVPVGRVSKVLSAQRKDIAASAFESDPQESAISREYEVLSLLPNALTPQELRVFNHIYGLNGAKKIEGTNAIAKAVGLNPSQVARLRTAIVKKYDQYK